ncbi:hypothetical protein QJS10_CPA06g00291 [Acorus calamus]|uniref:F-box domain-containing protein n=1 Tax=Acorus calamus TaxID=4465 RepID=A0AAV9EN63_ACOCL|nr:hypothetical protein QJS10_CPA06g00291 [Acorus calamus]
MEPLPLSPPQPETPPSPSPTTTRPWSRLPRIFTKNLLNRLEFPDYIRFSSVCHQWHISKRHAQTLPSPRFPWILLPYQLSNQPSLTFYSLSESRTYNLPIPCIQPGQPFSFIAASDGYILFESPPHSGFRTLFNPLTRACINLPQSTLSPPIVISCALTSPSSSLNDPDHWVVLAGGNVIFGWRPSDDYWFDKRLERGGTSVLNMAVDQEKRRLYVVMTDLELFEADVPVESDLSLLARAPRGAHVPKPSLEADHFLMVMPGEEEVLMAVVLYVVSCEARVGVERVELYKVREGDWVRVGAREIGDQRALLLSRWGSSMRSVVDAEGGTAGRALLVPDLGTLQTISAAQGRRRP